MTAPDLSTTVWRDEQWLQIYGIAGAPPHFVLHYMQLSPFWDPEAINDQAQRESKDVKSALAY